MKHLLTKSIACFAMLVFAAVVSAQDVIITLDAQKIDAKILEVSKTEIKYKEKNNLNGPTFILETKEISSVIYENGKVVLYNQEASVNTKKEESSYPVQSQSSIPTIDDNTAEILLLSGQTIIAQISDLEANYISYSINDNSYILSASQIEKVTFLKNGQVKTYNAKASTVISESQDKATSQASGRIYRDDGHYLHNNTYISSKEVGRILEREDKAAYQQWQKAEGMLIGGSICAGVGCGLVLGGLVSLVGDPIVCLSLECTALVPLGVGLGLTLASSSRYNKAIDIYNSKFDHAAVQLRWSVAPNGVGLALAF